MPGGYILGDISSCLTSAQCRFGTRLRQLKIGKKIQLSFLNKNIEEIPLTVKNEAKCRLDAVTMQSLFELAASIPVEFRHLFPAPDAEDLCSVKRAVSHNTNVSKIRFLTNPVSPFTFL